MQLGNLRTSISIFVVPTAFVIVSCTFTEI